MHFPPISLPPGTQVRGERQVALWLHSRLRRKKEVMLLPFENTQEETRRLSSSAEDYAPREYPLRASAAMTVKLLVIGGGVLGLLWMLDRFLAP